MNDFINAGIANSVQMAIGYPLDTAKVWIQSNQQLKPMTIRNLYSGIKYPLIGQGAATALCFSSYNYGIEQGVNPFLSALFSGFAISLVAVPVEILKITKQYEPCSNVQWSKHYKQCLIPVAMRETLFITSFLNLQRYFRDETEVSPLAYGAICSATSWILTYPLDTYKTNQILFHSLVKQVTKRPLFDIGLAYSLFRVSLGGSIFMTVYNWLQSDAVIKNSFM
jgi:hypothetical protein